MGTVIRALASPIPGNPATCLIHPDFMEVVPMGSGSDNVWPRATRYHADGAPRMTCARKGIPPRHAAFGVMMLLLPGAATAQGHVHEPLPPRDAVTDLMLAGPHLILAHRGLLALTEPQRTALQQLSRTLCLAEVAFVRQRDQGRARIAAAVSDAVLDAAPSAAGNAAIRELRASLDGSAAAEAEWLAALVGVRREARALLTVAQRAQVDRLRDHWAGETATMIEEATRPRQRGHPGMQIPIRVPGMVVGETTLLPYCEALHGPATHISIPPPR